ncbi:Na+/H+ antiporter subunit E [Saxibacter everestensis]|uniref:Na+/H+ antiporter subunit E n=1 Tax=Saxibacter everestensis TaxID=2909229 RepID=A0ABY8QUD2_9MICO|nr:Na+/H+ antiporter subunit E [Brevibacteriaceae bacterium ZFBP1038]
MMSPGATRVKIRRSLLKQLPLLVWLVFLWVMLWDHFSLLSVTTGIIVAVLVTRVLYLPPVELSGRFNLYWFLVFAGHFIVDVCRASVQVAAQAFDPRRLPVNSVIAASLHTNSDFLMTLVSQAVSLVPGSLVVEVDRGNSVLYLHVLGASSDYDVEKFRRNVLTTEERLVRALGTRDDIWRVNQFRTATGRKPMGMSRAQLTYEKERGLS